MESRVCGLYSSGSVEKLGAQPFRVCFPSLLPLEIVCSFVIPISRRGGAGLTVEDACSEKCHEASGVSCHTQLLVFAGLSERWTTLETSVSLPPRSVSRNSSPNRLLTVIPRAHTAVSSGSGNPLQAEEHWYPVWRHPESAKRK